MNSEELELSLRNEFESCLKDKLAEIRQEMVQFRERVEAEFEKHKTQLDEVFQDFSARVSEDKPLEAGFTETVVEHLRLARDEGSRVAVAAMEKAEAMQEEAELVVPKAGISELSAAISDISSKTTQSSILKTLVHHAGQFTPRGAFFIIKNEHLVGWRVFGNEGSADEQTVREVFFPVAAETVLGESVRSLSSVESSYGSYVDDSIYLNKLDFGHPSRMFAVPLIVRGRSVAVLYADNGNEGEEINSEALNTLARVASLTVEVLASAKTVKTTDEAVERTDEPEESGALDSTYIEPAKVETPVEKPSTENAFVMTSPVVEEAVSYQKATESTVEEEPQAEKAEEFSYQTEETFSEPEKSYTFEPAEIPEESQTEFSYQVVEEEAAEIPKPQIEFEAAEEKVEEVKEEFSYYDTETKIETEDYSTPAVSQYEAVNEYQFETNYQTEPVQSFEPAEEIEQPHVETTRFEFNTPQTVEEPAPVQNNFNQYEAEVPQMETPVVETVSEPTVAATTPSRSRFSDRNVDLPIEVGEDERRLHNDARRFARLLVSEIKLYNEQKVKEGRESNDLYERLREAIDRSREMYDKRVQPPVAARFDYFHYEVVSTLAEGDEHKLGASYPGAVV